MYFKNNVQLTVYSPCLAKTKYRHYREFLAFYQRHGKICHLILTAHQDLFAGRKQAAKSSGSSPGISNMVKVNEPRSNGMIFSP